eukprot:scpid49106/ scgid0354/ Heat shock factor protein 3; HSF 3C; HSTF 3C; Heat shock transcription factor 3
MAEEVLGESAPQSETRDLSEVNALQREPVPAFLQKLWAMVSDPETNNVICWAEDGKSFIVKNPDLLSQEILPKYFKHRNFSSFVRQLNLYNFIRSSGLGTNAIVASGYVVFGHSLFCKGHPNLLRKIKRKTAASAVKTSPQPVPVAVPVAPPVKAGGSDGFSQAVTGSLEKLQKQQEQIMVTLQEMNRDNRGLWTEMISLRRSVERHETIIAKLVKFIERLFKSRTLPPAQKRKRFSFESQDALEAPSKRPPPANDSTTELLDDLVTTFNSHRQNLSNATTLDCPIPITAQLPERFRVDEPRGLDLVTYTGTGGRLSPSNSAARVSAGAASTAASNMSEVVPIASASSATPSGLVTGIPDTRALKAPHPSQLSASQLPSLPDASFSADALVASKANTSALTQPSEPQITFLSPSHPDFLDGVHEQQVLDSGGPSLSPSWGLNFDKDTLQENISSVNQGLDTLLQQLTAQGVPPETIDQLLDDSSLDTSNLDFNIPLDDPFGKNYFDNDDTASSSPGSAYG